MSAWPTLIAVSSLVLGCTHEYDEFSFDTDTMFASCSDGSAECSAQCISSLASDNCGGCGNDCSAQGFGLVCVSAHCGCTESSQCGQGRCVEATARCQCAGITCQEGEACAVGNEALSCSCNGGPACAIGQTCCQTPAGCRDTESDPENCGFCGRRCPPGQSCLLAVCRSQT